VEELAALSTLSTAWGRSDLREIAEGLGVALCRALPLALAYVRVSGVGGSGAVEAACGPRGPFAPDEAREIGRAIGPSAESGAPGGDGSTIDDPFGNGTLHLLVARLGHDGDCGVVVVGSPAPCFPGQTDRLLVDVAAAQATIVLQQRQADERLRRQTDLFTTLVEHIPDIVSRLDRDLRFIYISPAVTPITGRPWQAYIGKPRTNQGLPPEYAQAREELSRKVFETGQEQRLEFPMLTSTGWRYMETRFIPEFAPDGSVESLMTLVRNVTEQKRAEERLRLLWEAAAVLLTASDPDGMLRELFVRIGPHVGVDVYFNHVIDDSGDALRLASCEGIPVEAAGSIARVELGEAVAGTAAARRQPVVVSAIQESDDPQVGWLESVGIRACVCHPLVAETRLLGTLSFASRNRDRFEPDEVAFLETICHYVTVAYERLRLLNELKEADRRKDEFLATLAHELRNPLAPLRNAAELLRFETPAERELHWGRDVIERQVDSLTRLIDDLLDISRINRNKLELRTQRVGLAEVIAMAVESSRPLIDERRHALTVDLPSPPVYLDGDLVRLAQVFLNLLNNAAKYTEPGGRIWLIGEQQGSDVVVRVKDTGVGIPAEKLSSVFELFFQVDGSLERSQGGLGIGLSLVRRLVELHGGRVKAHSEGVGKGSELTVCLPALAEMPTAMPSREPDDNRRPRSTSARRVLVVDDNRDSADSLAMLLGLSGNDVATAYDGLEALEVAERLRPDVVLLDIGMPKLNGYETCRRIRAEPWGQRMVLIALTGWGQEQDRRRTGDAGFDAHVVKPVDPNALLTLLGQLPQPPG
jgi:PAS domain S-box-containing protein